MPLLPIDRIEPGMRTASAILDSAGALLVKEGAEITPEILTRLRNRKIAAVDVAGPGTSSTRSTPDDLTADEQRLAHAFETVSTTEVMKALHRAALAHLHSRNSAE